MLFSSSAYSFKIKINQTNLRVCCKSPLDFIPNSQNARDSLSDEMKTYTLKKILGRGKTPRERKIVNRISTKHFLEEN